MARDYRNVANILRKRKDTMKTDQWVALVHDFCLVFATDNARFNEERFKKACGI